MDPNSSLGKICLGENIVVISSDKVEGTRDWNSPEFQDTANNNVPLLGEEELLPFVCKMGKSSCNKKWAMENLNFFYQDIGTSSSASGHLTQEEAVKEALAIRMSRKFVLLEKERPIIETMAYHDKYKKILDEIWNDKVELDGKIVKEDEEAVKRIKCEALKEKDDLGAFIFPIRLEGHLGREDMKKVDRGITMINHTQEKAMGILTNVLCQTFDGFCHQTFCATRSDVMRNAESDSDDKKEYQIQGNKFRAPIYGPKLASYLNCNDPAERSLAIQTVTNPLWKITIWKKVVSFLGSLPVPLKHVNWKPDYKGSYNKEEEATGQWRTKIRLSDPYGNIYLQGFTTKKTDRKLSKLWEHTMMRPDHQDPNALDKTKPWKRLREAESNEEILTSVAWIRAFNINELVYVELCHEFYSTYEFDEVCADDELQTKKIIKFRLGGRAHSLTLFEFAHRLGLYQADELEEDGFNVYFEGGLRSDEHFNAQEYWLSISQEENLGLSGSHTSTIQSPILMVIHKMITYAWLIALWMKRKGAGTQKESQICCGKFISKIARKCKVLTEDVVRSLSAPIYYRDLDTTPLRDLIDFKGKLIPEDPQPGVPRVGIPRPPRATMQDLYNRMSKMEICQEAIERMEYRQSYHWDRYQGVFEHMVGVYSVPL
ncbi:hypothetical protein Tco_0356278 [Tanacetum coccineum]